MLEDQGSLRDAIAHYERAVAMNEDARVRRRLARLYAQQGQIDRALEQLQTALRGGPGDPRLLRELARLLAAAGRHAESQAILENLERRERTAPEKRGNE
jgi:tetratricopeptide (TPR) repeat protein